jgi:hypothetical protein
LLALKTADKALCPLLAHVDEAIAQDLLKTYFVANAQVS